MPERVEISETSASRKTLDAAWSPRKKMLVGVLFAGVAMGTLGVGGYFAWQARPVSLPTSADQAIATISSPRFENLDEQRRRQYLAEAGRLLRELPGEQRSEMLSNTENREALGEIRQEFFDEMVRNYARGEDFEMPWGRGGGRPGGNRQRGGGDGEELTDEERDARRRERQEQFRGRLTEAFESGNAQSTALRGEFFKRLRAEGGFGGRQGGGGRPGGGGGR